MNPLKLARQIRRAKSCVLRASIETLEHRRHLSTSKAGAIDPAFGTHGIGSITVPNGGYINVTDLTVQSDGKLIIVGSGETTTPGSRIASDSPLAYGVNDLLSVLPIADVSQKLIVARLNADGTPDNTFNGNGFVVTDFNAPDAEATRVALDGDQIVVAGDASGNFALARYNADGSIDSHFGSHGTVSLDLGHDDDKAWGLAVQGDGKIVAAGQSGGETAVVRFNADGSLDTDFGTGGKTLVTAPGSTAVTAADGTGATLDGSGGVQILHGGKILVVSNETEADYTGRVDFLYFNAGGKLTALDQGASLDSPPGIVDFSAAASGKVITFSSDGSSLVQQYNADASLDTSFGNHGTAASTLDWGAYGAVQSDGKILVAGSGSIGYTSGMGVARYNADGSVDSTFGNNGQMVSINGGYSAAAVAVDRGGDIVIAGSGYSDNGPMLTAARFLPNVGVVIPTAKLLSAPTLSHSGNTQEVISVTYSAADGIDPSSLEDGDLTVTKAGSDDSNTLPTFFLDQTVNADGSITVRYQVQKDYAGHFYDALDNGSYTVSIADGSVYDFNGVGVAAGDLGTFGINIAQPAGGIHPPTATLGSSDVTAINVTDATVSVTFKSDIGLDANSLGGGITVTGPNDYDQYAYYQDSKVNADGSITATFSVQQGDSHQAFTSADNGTYSVAIDSGTVLDMDGNPLPSGTIGTFKVNVPAVAPGLTGPTATLQVSDLTDSSASQQTLTVTYAGPAAIAANTLDDYDLTVTASDGSTVTANFNNSTLNADGSTTAVYTISVGYGGIVPLTAGIASPTATSTSKVAKAVSIGQPIPIWEGWGLSNGTYTVALVANQVNDIRGASAAPATLGSFTVNLPPRATPPNGPIFLDAVGDVAKTATDAHHANATPTASLTASTGHTPTRAHVGVKHKKHHKHKKHKPAK